VGFLSQYESPSARKQWQTSDIQWLGNDNSPKYWLESNIQVQNEEYGSNFFDNSVFQSKKTGISFSKSQSTKIRINGFPILRKKVFLSEGHRVPNKDLWDLHIFSVVVWVWAVTNKGTTKWSRKTHPLLVNTKKELSWTEFCEKTRFFSSVQW
jgi:hypothetical protein